MITIAVVNLKGGSGKSSTCYHLGGMFARRGKRVLLVDGDPQASLTQGFWGSQGLDELEASRTIAAVYQGEPPPERVIHPSGFDGISLLPGHDDATSWNLPPNIEWGHYPLAIRSLIREVRSEYDYCLIDCPPNLHLCTFSAMIAADYTLIPLQAEDFGAQGTVKVNQAIATVQTQRSGSPRVLGYLLTFFDKRLAIHQVYADGLRRTFGDRVLTTFVPYAKDYKVAVAARMPISHHKKSGVAWKAIADLADEVEARLALDPAEEGRAA